MDKKKDKKLIEEIDIDFNNIDLSMDFSNINTDIDFSFIDELDEEKQKKLKNYVKRYKNMIYKEIK